MITKAAIKNFKAFRDAEINLSNLNLFTGMNGMGKSSFIQSLLLLRQSQLNNPSKNIGLSLKGDLVDIGKGKDVYSINADSDLISIDIDYNYKSYIRSSFEYVAENDVLNAKDFQFNTIDNLDECSLFNNNFQYLKADRISPDHTYRANIFQVQRLGTLGTHGEHTPLFIALNKLKPLKLKSVRHEKATTDNLIDNIDAWLNEITPGTHVVSTYLNDLDIVKLVYNFETANDVTPDFSPMNVGFGFTYTLPVITAILSAKPDDLIIIENPESHLHPHGQVKMGELIAKAANDGVQIIVESHSDHLFNGIRVAIKLGFINPEDTSVFYFERDESSKEHITNISQPEIDKNGRLSFQPKGFFDETAKQLDILLK